MFTHDHTIRVRYAETDQMGVVHHSSYVLYTEEARTEALRSLGVSYKNVEDWGVAMPVFNMNFDFKKAAYYDDLLTIKTILQETPTVRIKFLYEVYNQKNELLTQAQVTLYFVDRATGRPTRCPKYLLDLLTPFF
ncbi:MAG: thioesterase family protein [Bacteroidota bacterium]|nr:thioesterase family protein [Bacteroidota bacterium]